MNKDATCSGCTTQADIRELFMGRSWCVLKTVLALVGGMWWDVCHGPSGPLVAQTAGFLWNFF